MKKALYEDYLDMEIGQPVVVNIHDSVCDIALFLGFNQEKGVAIVCDCLMNTNEKYTPNIAEYKDIYILSNEKEDLLKLLQKKM